MNELKLFDEVTKTDVLSTVFDDGMIVNAGDLSTAMNYPMEMFRTLVRAYFGCGIVCGLELKKYPQDAEETWCLQVLPGTALDCNANPLKLCDRVVISLKPDLCAREEWPTCVCIAIRRDTVPEGARTDSDDCDGKKKCSYRRLRETVRVKAFKCEVASEDDDHCKPGDLPKNICMSKSQGNQDKPYDDNGNTRFDSSFCDCLKECGDCECCDDSWVLLGCVTLGDCGIESADFSGRKYVKPIECLCGNSESQTNLQSNTVAAGEAPAQVATNKVSKKRGTKKTPG